MEDNTVEWRLLVRIMNSSADEEQVKRFTEWTDADPARKEFFLRAKADWDNGGMAVREDPEKMLGLLIRRLDVDAAPAGGPGKRRVALRWIAAGAAAFIAFCGLLLHHFINPPIVEASESLSENIFPGSNKAILTLGDGTMIALSDDPFEVKQNGVVISNDNEGNLRYLAGEEDLNIGYNTLVVPRGGSYRLTLFDGTVVWLNSDSELRYPTRFTGDKRRVELRGEAFFEVEYNAGQPFIVGVDDYHVEVLGTKFNVSAYPDDDDRKTTLISGSVKVTVDGLGISDILVPGMQHNYNLHTKESSVTEVDTGPFTAWKNGIFEFRNSSFEKLIRIVSRWYDFEYRIVDPELRHYHFSGVFNMDDSIDDFIRILESSKIPLHIVYDGNIIQFDRKENYHD